MDLKVKQNQLNEGIERVKRLFIELEMQRAEFVTEFRQTAKQST